MVTSPEENVILGSPDFTSTIDTSQDFLAEASRYTSASSISNLMKSFGEELVVKADLLKAMKFFFKSPNYIFVSNPRINFPLVIVDERTLFDPRDF